MDDHVLEIILELIQKKYPIGQATDWETLDYVAGGFVDSLGLVQFVIELEDEFGIEFTDEELENPAFKVVGTLAEMIRRKVAEA